eukprot:CAMPEP_0170588106 /NCGR_PEP_ID=MMETSP0224-20130122/10650_1 /TAXON_ID=285029 /ORGANISM="Togula jolla, Strain CCCM 725" /LENGTH=30 /DNA_ID= /DNA_START= /DNA_END= /DNA_ORIENTATION=
MPIGTIHKSAMTVPVQPGGASSMARPMARA